MGEARFEWDERKNRANRLKHLVDFGLAQRAFLDPDRLILADEGHGDGEKRFFCIGRVDGAVMTFRFTWRDGCIRIFGADYWRKGRNIYERKAD